MEPENTPLEEENRLNQTKPLFSGSMLIFGAVKKGKKHTSQTSSQCSNDISTKTVPYIYIHNVAITCYIDEISLK